jgi:hypothetical protein
VVRQLRHSFALDHRALWIAVQKMASWNIVIAIHAARFTVKVHAITREGNEIPQKSLPSGNVKKSFFLVDEEEKR